MEETKKDKAASKLSVERVYQKKTQLEHILLRPDTYIGSVEPTTQVSPEQTAVHCRHSDIQAAVQLWKQVRSCGEIQGLADYFFTVQFTAE